MTPFRVQIREPYEVEVIGIEVPEPGAGQVRVRSLVSAISPGTELLAYRGELPEQSDNDTVIDPLTGTRSYPMWSGYSVVGTVEETGSGVSDECVGRAVFGFQPHGTHFIASLSELIELPDDVPGELATFIPNLETAIGLVMDARPVLGERVLVTGQGIVGLLVTRLLARFPLELLVTLDRIPERRAQSVASGAHVCLDPDAPADREELTRLFRGQPDRNGADLIFELSGNPAALNDAVELAGYGGRVVVGSWYGSKSAPLALGGHFHRNRISIVSSQVSTIGPDLSGRWNKQRRMQAVLAMLPHLRLDELITHRFPGECAGEAFALLDQRPGEAIQVLLDYQHEA